MNRKVSRIIIFTIMLLISLGVAGCGSDQSNPTSTPISSQPVSTDVTEANRTLAEAKIIPIKNIALGFTFPGVVDEILVTEGEQIAEGEVIARLKGVNKAKSAITQAEVALLSAQKNLDDFAEKSKIATAEAELALAKAKIELQSASDARESLDYQQVSNTSLDGLRATYIIALDDFKKADEDYQPYQDRSEKDLDRAAFLSKLSVARLNRDQALFNLNKAMENPDAEKIAKADARLAVAKAMVNDAQTTYDRLKDGPDPDEIVILEAALRNAKAQLESAKSELADLELKAPFSGTVVSSGLKIGQAVGPSTVVMLGDISSWQVETTDLTEVDIVEIKVGDPVTITLDAIPNLDLNGHVDRIKNIGESNKGDTTYTAYINLDQTDPRLLWNMKAFVSFFSKSK